MKRKFLEDLGLEKEVIDKIMAENGADIENAKKPYADYEDIKSQLATANTTISDLKEKNKDNETLQATITQHETTIADLQKKADDTRKEFELKDALKAANVLDPDYLIYKHGGLDKFNFDKDGKVVGLDDTLKPYKESNSSWFKQEEKPGFGPFGGGAGAGNNNPPSDINAQLANAFGVTLK